MDKFKCRVAANQTKNQNNLNVISHFIESYWKKPKNKKSQNIFLILLTYLYAEIIPEVK